MRLTPTVDKFIQDTVDHHLEVRDTAALALAGQIIQDTPVLDGYLRGSWQLGGKLNDLFNEKTKARIDKGGKRTLSFMQLSIRDIGMTDDVYIFNNLIYGPIIEFTRNYSLKAPRGMVVINARRWRGLVARVAKALK